MGENDGHTGRVGDVERGRVPDMHDGGPLVQPRTSAHELVAAFDSPERGERAVASLRDAGIRSGRLTLLERAAGTQVAEGESPEEEPETDVQWATRFAKGAAAGGGAGAALGLIIGLVVFIGLGVGSGWPGVFGAVIAIGGAGAVAGGLAAVFLNIWDMSYRDAASEGRAVVELQTDDEGEAKHAIAVLQRYRPTRLDHFDQAGERIGMHH